jgi:formylmethanofuran dehydrogenase subunit E
LEDEEEELPDVEEDEDDDDADAEPDLEEEPAEASLDEILAKKPEERASAEEEEEDEESILSLGREERIETLTVKVIPPDPQKEFTCRKCYLVKHRSQLADKKRMYCRDCA